MINMIPGSAKRNFGSAVRKIGRAEGNSLSGDFFISEDQLHGPEMSKFNNYGKLSDCSDCRSR